MDNFIPILPELFLAIAVGLNVSKWVYFLLRIRSFISIETALGNKEEVMSRDDGLNLTEMLT